MTIALPEAPGVYDSRNDKSGFISTQGGTVAAIVGYSKKGPLKPVLLTTTTQLDSVQGRPDVKVGFAHYAARHLINNGIPVYFRRITNGARYGGVAVLSNPANNSVTADPYPVTGSAFPADPDPSLGISPTGPGYVALTFNGPLVASNSVTMNLVLDSAVVAVTPVSFTGSSDATMVAIAAAIETAMAAAGDDGKAVVIDNDPTSTTNARTIGIFAPSGQRVGITGVAVTGGSSQATVTQQTPIGYVQAENPGAHSRGIGYKFTNADVGQKEVINMTFGAAVGSVSTLTVTINDVACDEVSNVTPSDAFLAAVAAAIQSHPDVATAEVTKRPLGEDNDRSIVIRMLRGSATDTAISHVVSGATPTITYTQIVKGRNPSGAFDFEVYTSDNPTLPVERHRVSIASQTDLFGTQQQISYVVNESGTASEIVRFISNAPDDGSVVMPFDPVTGNIMDRIQWLSAGTDGALPTSSQIAEAYKEFEDTELYKITTLVNAGYYANTVQQAMADVAKKRNDGTHAILDIPPQYQKFTSMVSYRQQQMPIDTEYASAYYPDVQYEDPYTKTKFWMPNSAHAAVVFGNNDRVRGVGKAPAGLRVGRVSTSAVRYDYKDEEHNVLFGLKLNPIRRQSGAYYIMGDTTLQIQNSALSFVNIARLIGFLQGRVREKAKFYMFEGINDSTVFSLVTDIDQFLAPWVTSEDLNEYEVVSNLSNNPNGMTDQGNRIVDVILDPTRSMRRILVRSTITATGGVASIEVSEI